MATIAKQKSLKTHPLLDIILLYFNQFQETKELNEELDNLNFHRQFGLTISVPDNWPLSESIHDIIRYSLDSGLHNIIVIYPSSKVYRDLYSKEQDITYFAWQEFYVAMDRAGKDVREIRRFRYLLVECPPRQFFMALQLVLLRSLIRFVDFVKDV